MMEPTQADSESHLRHALPALLDSLWASNAYDVPGTAWIAFSSLACLSHTHANWVHTWRTGLHTVSLDGGAICNAAIYEIARRCTRLHTLYLSRAAEISDPWLAAGSRWYHLKNGDVAACGTIRDSAIVALASGCPGLTRIDLAGCTQLTEIAVGAIARHCSALTELDLSDCLCSSLPVADERANGTALSIAIAELASSACATTLTSLDLTRTSGPSAVDCSVTSALAAGCPHLTCLRLVNAAGLTGDVTGYDATDDGKDDATVGMRDMDDDARTSAATRSSCTGLSRLPLHTLDLFGCTSLHPNAIVSSLQPDALHTLHLSECPGATDSALRTIAASCHALRELRLYACPNVIDDALLALAASCQHLSIIDLSMTAVRSETVQAIATRCDLTAIWLFGCFHIIDDECLASLAAHCPRLQVLDLSLLTPVLSQAHLLAVASRCQQLHTLSLCGCIVQPSTHPDCPLWPAIHAMRALRRLDVCDLQVPGSPSRSHLQDVHASRDGLEQCATSAPFLRALVHALAKCCPHISRLGLNRLPTDVAHNALRRLPTADEDAADALRHLEIHPRPACEAPPSGLDAGSCAGSSTSGAVCPTLTLLRRLAPRELDFCAPGGGAVETLETRLQVWMRRLQPWSPHGAGVYMEVF